MAMQSSVRLALEPLATIFIRFHELAVVDQ